MGQNYNIYYNKANRIHHFYAHPHDTMAWFGINMRQSCGWMVKVDQISSPTFQDTLQVRWTYDPIESQLQQGDPPSESQREHGCLTTSPVHWNHFASFAWAESPTYAQGIPRHKNVIDFWVVSTGYFEKARSLWNLAALAKSFQTMHPVPNNPPDLSWSILISEIVIICEFEKQKD